MRDAAETPEQAERQVVRVRFAQALQCQPALRSGDDEAVHAFRLACKRLRFAIERLTNRGTGLEGALTTLERLTDLLGWAHDCAELARLAGTCNAPLVAARALRDRDRYVLRASRRWRHAFRAHGEFEGLAAYTTFRWSLE